MQVTRAHLLPWLLAAALGAAGGCSDEAPAGVGAAGESPASTQVAGAETGAAREIGSVRPAPGTWLASYDGLQIVLEGVRGEDDGGAVQFRGGAQSEWMIEDLRLRDGRLSFDLRRGGTLTGKLVRFEGRFVEERRELRGTLYDGAESSELAFRRQG